MSKNRYFLVVVLFIVLGLFPWSSFQQPSEFSTTTTLDHKMYSSSEGIYTPIDSVFTAKSEEYNSYGFYPQLYESSLQATYYGLYILDAIGKLEQVNETQIIMYIMNAYNSELGIFMDEYSYRFLDYDFTRFTLYPLTSLLQVHCYAVLSLELLGSLTLIDIEESKDFIWSCYNNYTSGFIGQSFNSGLEYYAQVASMDNTYYAVQTLDILGETWAEYNQEHDDLIWYINSLQVSNSKTWDFGGFANDNESFFFPLRLYADTTMFSSYYGIKTLELFGMEETINYDNFYLFLEELYNPADSSFQYKEGMEQTFANVVATALALDLSRITGFTSYNESGAIEFVFNNRDSLGIWVGSTEIQYHELIDTFQIIRVLYDTGLISQLSFEDTALITDTLLDYFLTPTSFCLISKDYTTLNLLHTIISSYELYDDLPSLDFQGLYQKITSAYYQDYRYVHGFASIGDPEHYNDGTLADFRSFPIEFFSRGNKQNTSYIDYFFSHKYTYFALDSLQKLFKLDDFALTCNLHNLVNDILDTQFLNSSYLDFYGAFSYMIPYGDLGPQMLIDDIFFEYSFYAIKSLELLTEFLNIGDLTFLDIDIPALQSYINYHIEETSEYLSFNPHYTDNVETILQNTYYMVYILKALDVFDLDSEKISTLVSTNLNYSNIKNIYYSFMLSRILEYDISFNSALVQTLVEDIFFEPSHEFFLTSNRDRLDQEIFLWICEMIQGDSFRLEAWYPHQSVLGGEITITASLHNNILTYSGSNISFVLESDQLGNHIFEQSTSNNYSLTLTISQSASNYPEINAKIISYISSTILAELNMVITTFYPKGEYEQVLNSTMVLSVLFITVPGGIIVFSERKLRKEKPKL